MTPTSVSLVALDATNAARDHVTHAETHAKLAEYERAEVWAAIGTAHAALAIAVRLAELTEMIRVIAVRLAELTEMIRVIGEGIGGDLGSLTSEAGPR